MNYDEFLQSQDFFSNLLEYGRRRWRGWFFVRHDPADTIPVPEEPMGGPAGSCGRMHAGAGQQLFARAVEDERIAGREADLHRLAGGVGGGGAVLEHAHLADVGLTT